MQNNMLPNEGDQARPRGRALLIALGLEPLIARLRLETPIEYVIDNSFLHPLDYIDETIDALQHHGVTRELIETHWEPINSLHLFNHTMREALIFFVTGQARATYSWGIRMLEPLLTPLSPVVALREITRLSALQLELLLLLYPRLRGEDLRTWNGEVSDLANPRLATPRLLMDELTGDQSPVAQEAMRLLQREYINNRPDRLFATQTPVSSDTQPTGKNEQRLKNLGSKPELTALGYTTPVMPNEMQDPISLELMDDPVYIENLERKNKYYQAFEKTCLLKWQKIKPTNPLDPSERINKLIPATELRKEIAAWLHHHEQIKEFYERCWYWRKTPGECSNQHNRVMLFSNRLLKDATLLDPYDNSKAVVSWKPQAS